MLQEINVSAEISCLLVYCSVERVCMCVCVYVCVVIKGNSFCVDAVALCLTARASIEGDVPCFFNKEGMDEIRCVECRLVV